ncbi:hypothetical protein HDZ31DRAFT_44669 [Schizophyllum fasciatum]
MASQVMDTDIIVNGFAFCQHGQELCHCRCSLVNDYTFLNDRTFMQTNRSPLVQYIKFTMAIQGAFIRMPLSIAGQFTVIEKKKGPHSAACIKHKRRDCQECFNWEKAISQQLADKLRAEDEELESPPDKAALVKINDRERVLTLLRSMGINFPESTKLPADVLNKRLDAALNCAQFVSSYSSKFPLDPSNYPAWEGKSVEKGVRRGNAVEAFEAERIEIEGRVREPFPLYINAFMDLRQTILHLARNFDAGRSMILLENIEQTESICVRITGVHALDEKTPVFSLLYVTGSVDAPSLDVLAFIRAQMPSGVLIRTLCTAEEQSLLRKLLFMNSEKMSPQFKPKRESYEKNFIPSFLLPVGALGQIDIGKLTSDTGCAICGKKTTSRCTGCLSVSYCGQACQKVHWKEHKDFCRTIRGGKWCSVKFTTQLLDSEGNQIYVSTINHSSMKVTPIGGPGIPVVTPPNVHGDNVFLVKIQRPDNLGPCREDTVSMMVYDRNRTFHGYITRRDNPAGYYPLLALLAGGKPKVYRWAKRTDDWVLNVCLDRAPATAPQW